MQQNVTSISPTHYSRRGGQQWTFISDMNGRKSQIDFILKPTTVSVVLAAIID